MKEIKEDDYKQLINLILKENPEALLASLSFTNIKNYLQKHTTLTDRIIKNKLEVMYK